ncbi:ABC transporter permease [Fulvivirgaceae bacterium PWU5]|uniref:ABC transporter permease n=1 Tax=Dawidia cretensis TaxID=2782350 RepID=A0AAP2DW83_9BACT|nr:ABC transporter permease [Dawidia cretensis]MBT1707358.1 ABC transporter permease [Dawidia cretensis]
MFKNYFKIALRNLVHNKSFSSINIIGLSIGMTCCLIIFQYVSFESGFDSFHEKKDDLYRVTQTYVRKGEVMGTGAYTAQALMTALQEGVPEIVNVTRVHPENAIVSSTVAPDRVFEEDRALYVDAAFLQMFSFPMASGNAGRDLRPGTVLLSETAARKYFDGLSAVGQTLEVTGNVEKSFTVSGVFRDVPSNSHLQFDMLLPMEDLLKTEDYAHEPEGGWSWNNFTTYIELHPGADRAVVDGKMTEVYIKHRGEFLRQQGASAAFRGQPLSDIHLNSEINGTDNIVTGSYKTVYFFLVIGLITLVIALVNYINLATARALNRSREVGVRKAVGAKRQQLIIQFLCESAFTNVCALLIALALTSMLLPMVNSIADVQLAVEQWLEPPFLLAIGATLLSGTLLAGLYPAFVLSSFRPATVLKGKGSSVSAHVWLRKGLVITQFSACIVLIAGTAIVYNQLDFMRSLDLGLKLEQVIAVQAPRVLSEGVDRPSAMQTFLTQIREMPGVEQTAMSSTLPGKGFNWNGASIRNATEDPAAALRGVATYIDSAFASLYGLQLVAGKDFSQITLQEDGEGSPWLVIVNETTSKNLGYASAASAVDELLDIGGNEARIIGVYRDFNWSSAHQAQQNIVFGRTPAGREVSVRLAARDYAVVIDKIQSVYTSMFPGNLFHYSFVDETFDLQYRNDQRFAKLFSIFAGMAIFIACLGLFGLVAFTAQQRTKEIGMRKVLGASVTGIVALLSKDFLKLVIVGFVLAVPVTIYIMNQWLANFAYRTEISIGTFVLSGALALLIALLTVSWQSFKAATANPVKSLRSE